MTSPSLPALAALALLTALPVSAAGPGSPAADRATFAPCTGAQRVTCVVDGDTFWLRGRKIRIADINTPEVSHPACPREAELGAAATRRLVELLNAGPFTLAPWPGRDTDRYGRQLRVVMRGGASLGERLTAEGLAEPWQGRRGDWCA